MAKKGRNKNKYFEHVSKDPNFIDPRSVYKPLKEETTLLRTIFAKRRWVNFMLKMDIHRYFTYRATINDPAKQLWMCGDQMVIDQNPEKNVDMRSFCMKTKKWCCGTEGDSTHEFFSVCPHCKHVFVAIKGTTVPCDYCRRELKPEEVKTWVKYNCVNCPAHITLDE